MRYTLARYSNYAHTDTQRFFFLIRKEIKKQLPTAQHYVIIEYSYKILVYNDLLPRIFSRVFFFFLYVSHFFSSFSQMLMGYVSNFMNFGLWFAAASIHRDSKISKETKQVQGEHRWMVCMYLFVGNLVEGTYVNCQRFNISR